MNNIFDMLFFSGGSALQDLSKILGAKIKVAYIMHGFDSGGSSGHLRNVLNVPAFGDIRNRLVALANDKNPKISEILPLLQQRLPDSIDTFAKAYNYVIQIFSQISKNNEIAIHFLEYFKKTMQSLPQEFDFKDANIGNFILAGIYLVYKDIDITIKFMEEILQTRGKIFIVTATLCQIGASLENGEVIVGQKFLTGKEVPPLNSKIKKLFLCASERDSTPICPVPNMKLIEVIRNAKFIIFPMGSFYTSIFPGLLIKEIVHAIKKSKACKIFIPNTTIDAELYGCSIVDTTKTLLSILGGELDLILMDLIDVRCNLPDFKNLLHQHGVRLIQKKLTNSYSNYIDANYLSDILMQEIEGNI